MCGRHDTAIFPMLYLKVLLTVWFHKIFELIFLKQLSWPKTMYAEHWRKLAWATFQGNFLILLVQQFCGVPIKNKFSHSAGYFDFLFWFSSAILLPKMKSLFLNLYTSPQGVTSLLQQLLLQEVCTNLQVKRFLLMKFWYLIWMYGGSNIHGNIIQKHPSHKYLFFLKLLE